MSVTSLDLDGAHKKALHWQGIFIAANVSRAARNQQ